MKLSAILVGAALFASSTFAPRNPYPNEIRGLKLYERYLQPLTPRKSDAAQVHKVLGSDGTLQLKDWRVVALYSYDEGDLICSHAGCADRLASVEVTPTHRVSLRGFKFPTTFSRSWGSISEINVACNVYSDDFGLEYWVVSKSDRTYLMGDLLMIRYGYPHHTSAK